MIATAPRPRVVALELDGSLRAQQGLLPHIDSWLDLGSLADRVRLRADASDAHELRLRLLAAVPPESGPHVTLLGSGDFHHLTLPLFQNLSERSHNTGPISLVTFDNHPDYFREFPPNHCGNWVSSALSNASSVTLIGCNSSDLAWYRFYAAPLPELASGKLRLVPLRLQTRFVPCVHHSGPHASPSRLGTRFLFRPVADGGIDQALEALAGQSVYISIDKDCLPSSQAATDWDQGALPLSTLISAVISLAERCQIVGADITGERAHRPLTGLSKRLDAGRHRPFQPPTPESIRAAESVNLRLLSALGAVPSPQPELIHERSRP